MTPMGSKYRRSGQTATAFSLDQGLFDQMESYRKHLHMDRSNFIRYCISRELLRSTPSEPPPKPSPDDEKKSTKER